LEIDVAAIDVDRTVLEEVVEGTSVVDAVLGDGDGDGVVDVVVCSGVFVVDGGGGG
jgi:hypothetical protein